MGGAPVASPGCSETEELLEEIAEPKVEIERASLQPGMPGAVIRCASRVIGENGVGLVNLLEPFLGPGVLVDIRVIELRQPTIGLPHIFGARLSTDFEDLVIISLSGHGVRLEMRQRPPARPPARRPARPPVGARAPAPPCETALREPRPADGERGR